MNGNSWNLHCTYTTIISGLYRFVSVSDNKSDITLPQCLTWVVGLFFFFYFGWVSACQHHRYVPLSPDWRNMEMIVCLSSWAFFFQLILHSTGRSKKISGKHSRLDCSFILSNLDASCKSIKRPFFVISLWFIVSLSFPAGPKPFYQGTPFHQAVCG